ncbi:MAG TPA: DNA-packaging protein, partial [Alphaproteobacteria bacterium]|nr:DNA-packaging protein [Alphaproteobacteria bacterium]
MTNSPQCSPSSTTASSNSPLATQTGWSQERIGRGVERVWPEWFVQALPGQYPLHREPPVWLVVGGRGAGKTRLGAEWVNALARGLAPFARHRHGQIALVGETLADVRRVMIEGVSGLMAIHCADERPELEISKAQLVWPNGTIAQMFSAEDPDSLRGPQFDAAWCDELAKWRRPEETWDMLQFGMRL